MEQVKIIPNGKLGQQTGNRELQGGNHVCMVLALASYFSEVVGIETRCLNIQTN